MAWKGIVNRQLTPDTFRVYVDSLRFGAWRPSFIVLHNTGVPKLSDWKAGSDHQRMLNLEHYYRDIQGWSGGPHLFISRESINVFTPLTVPGVHTPSWNSVSWGVEMVGDYTAEAFDPKVRENTVSALATLHAALGIDTHTLRLHKEDMATTHRDCPGKHVDKSAMIEAIHEEIVRRQPGDHQADRPG